MPLIWTSNGKVWLALYDDQWAKIQRVDDHDCPYHAYIGNAIPIKLSHEIVTDDWNIANKTCITLEQAQAWAAEKLGVKL